MLIRFVHGTDFVSRLIEAHEQTTMPFVPSHVEAVTPEGTYLGAHYTDGVKERRPGYDAAWVALELVLNLEATPEQDRTFYDFLRSKVGEPYDWQAIAGFLLPGHHHDVNHAICSALVGVALRECRWFPHPLAAPWHLISPRTLLLILSGRVAVTGD